MPCLLPELQALDQLAVDAAEAAVAEDAHDVVDLRVPRDVLDSRAVGNGLLSRQGWPTKATTTKGTIMKRQDCYISLSARATLCAVLCMAALLFATSQPAHAAVIEAWVVRYDSLVNSNDGAVAVAVDGSGNVVMTGYTHNGWRGVAGYIAKYAAADGALFWEKRSTTYAEYNAFWEEGRVAPAAMAVDSSGNVVVTGSAAGASGFERYMFDPYTAKYAAADGALLWEKRGPRGGGFDAVVVDGSGNVAVTGRTPGAGGLSDYYTAKYAAADGTLLWEQRYDGPANDYDYPKSIAVDGSGNVVVTGNSSRGVGGLYDYYTAKYAAADGTLLWEQRYDGPPNHDDYAMAVAVDRNGNVVVTGSSAGNELYRFDCYTAKYAAADGALLWEKRGPAGAAMAAAVDDSGNVVITGNSGYSGYYTAKYAAAEGALLWEKHGPSGSAEAVAVDGRGDVVVTGTTYRYDVDGENADYYTAKYAAADGALLWEKHYNGPVNGIDTVNGSHSLALGPNGMVAITGSSDSLPGSNREYDYATIVYREILPPVIICPANTKTTATGSAGAVVTFTVTATDDSSVPPTVTCAPASGSVFPIGQTTVACTATDGDGLSGTCSFTVTVQGARGIKQGVLAGLIALRATVTDQGDGRQLDEAIAHLTQSLAGESWLDEIHLERKHGAKVFHEEKEAIRNLCDLIQSRKSHLPDTILQVFIDQLIQADRLLASVAIEEAITAGVSGNRIEQAQKFLARGDAEAADGKCANGIEEYRKAWKRAARAKVSPPVRMADGRVRLEIAGEAGERFIIQCSSNLKDWVTLGTRTTNAEGVLTFEDADAGPHRTRFYRVVLE